MIDLDVRTIEAAALETRLLRPVGEAQREVLTKVRLALEIP